MPRSESNFTHNHLDFQKKFTERNPQTLAYRGRKEKGRGWEGIKGFTPLKEVQRERAGQGRGNRDGREKEGASGRGDLAPRS